jgi:hypothetical protein
MRAGYLVIGAGLALVKCPLIADASTMPLYQGVTVCMLTAMSPLALLGLRHPVRMLPVLLFESAWKLLWLSLVALPKAIGPGLDAGTTQTLFSCSLVVVILAVILPSGSRRTVRTSNHHGGRSDLAVGPGAR